MLLHIYFYVPDIQSLASKQGSRNPTPGISQSRGTQAVIAFLHFCVSLNVGEKQDDDNGD